MITPFLIFTLPFTYFSLYKMVYRKRYTILYYLKFIRRNFITIWI